MAAIARVPYVTSHSLQPNPSGRAPALTLAGYAPCDRAPPEMHPLKMFEILGHPHFQQLHGHKIPMNATNLPDRLNLYIFSLNLSYHSFVSVHDIQQKRLLNKISVYTFTHPGGHHRVANATLFVACTRDGCATFGSPVTSSEVTWFTWSPLWRSTHLPNSEIFIARNNAFFIATAHVVKDAAHGEDAGITMSMIFAYLRVSSSVQVRVVARRTMASAGKRKMTWSCTKYVAVISAQRFSIWQKGSG